MQVTTTANITSRQIPAGVWVLGFVSMLMDISSEMIHSLLPLFMITTLGVGAFAVGLIEGLAESTALILKVFSGTLSDYLGKRKGLALVGYGLGALTKPLFAIASGTGSSWCSPRGCWIGSAKGCAVPRAMRWLPISPRRRFAVQRLVCASRLTPWGRLLARCWRSA